MDAAGVVVVGVDRRGNRVSIPFEEAVANGNQTAVVGIESSLVTRADEVNVTDVKV